MFRLRPTRRVEYVHNSEGPASLIDAFQTTVKRQLGFTRLLLVLPSTVGLGIHSAALGGALAYFVDRGVLERGNPVTPRLDQPRDPDLAGNRLPVARPDDWETADLIEDLPTGEQDERGQMGTDLPAGDAASVEEGLVGVKRMDRLVLGPGKPPEVTVRRLPDVAPGHPIPHDRFPEQADAHVAGHAELEIEGPVRPFQKAVILEEQIIRVAIGIPPTRDPRPRDCSRYSLGSESAVEGHNNEGEESGRSSPPLQTIRTSNGAHASIFCIWASKRLRSFAGRLTQ